MKLNQISQVNESQAENLFQLLSRHIRSEKNRIKVKQFCAECIEFDLPSWLRESIIFMDNRVVYKPDRNYEQGIKVLIEIIIES